MPSSAPLWRTWATASSAPLRAEAALGTATAVTAVAAAMVSRVLDLANIVSLLGGRRLMTLRMRAPWSRAQWDLGLAVRRPFGPHYRAGRCPPCAHDAARPTPRRA